LLFGGLPSGWVTKMIGFLLFFYTLSRMVPLPKTMSPPAIPFKVVFCMGVGWFNKSSRCGVTQHDVPESIIDCVISCVNALLAISMLFLAVSCFDHVFLFSEVVPHHCQWLHRVCKYVGC
jgi:hypothetical protein